MTMPEQLRRADGIGLSVVQIGSLVVLAVVVGIAWGTLSNGLDTVKTSLGDMRRDQDRIERRLDRQCGPSWRGPMGLETNGGPK